MEIDNLLNKLEQSCHLVTEQDFVDYSAAIEELKKLDDVIILIRMFRCFRDVEGNGIQYELLEACEKYEAEIYVKIFFEESEGFFSNAPSWFELCFLSILNATNYLEYFFTEFFNSNDETQSFFVERIKGATVINSKYNIVMDRILRI